MYQEQVVLKEGRYWLGDPMRVVLQSHMKLLTDYDSLSVVGQTELEQMSQQHIQYGVMFRMTHPQGLGLFLSGMEEISCHINPTNETSLVAMVPGILAQSVQSTDFGIFIDSVSPLKIRKIYNTGDRNDDTIEIIYQPRYSREQVVRTISPMRLYSEFGQMHTRINMQRHFSLSIE